MWSPGAETSRGPTKGSCRWKAPRDHGSHTVHAVWWKGSSAVSMDPTGRAKACPQGKVEKATEVSEEAGRQALGPIGPCPPEGEPAWQLGEPKPSFGAVNPEVARSGLSEPKLRGSIPRGASRWRSRERTTRWVHVLRFRWQKSPARIFRLQSVGVARRRWVLGAIAGRKHASPADGGHGLRDGERVCGTFPDLLSRDDGSGTLRGFRLAKMQVDGRRLSLRLVFALIRRGRRGG